MRVHDDIIIKRRGAIEDVSDYEEYRPFLREDFQRICGHCGKSETVTRKGFEIDHFVPKKIAPKRVNDYYNLVYSCFTCNRKKSSKWPTNDKNVHHNDEVGFVDPVSCDFDKHLERTEDGNIIGITNVGKYMCKEGFRFNSRPIKEIWKYMTLLKKKQIIIDKLDKLSDEDRKCYIEIDQCITELHNHLFEKKE